MKIILSTEGLGFLTVLIGALKNVTRRIKFETTDVGVTVAAAGAEFLVSVTLPEAYMSTYEKDDEVSGFEMDLGILEELMDFSVEKIFSISIEDKNLLISITDDSGAGGSSFAIKSPQFINPNSHKVEDKWDYEVKMRSMDLDMMVKHCSLSSDIVEIEMTPLYVKFKSLGDDINVSIEKHKATTQDMIIDGAEKKSILLHFNSKLLCSFTSLGSIVEEVGLYTCRRRKYPLMIVYNVEQGCDVQVLMKGQSTIARTLKIVFKAFRIVGKCLWNNKEDIICCLTSIGGC